MELKVYINGKLYPKEDAKISVFDHGLLYGDGVFEGIRCYNGRMFKFSEHIDRLYNSARAIYLEIPMTKEEIKNAVKDTLDANNMKDSYIRLVVTRGIGKLGLDPFNCSKPQIIIITDLIELYPRELYEKGLDAIVVPTIRNHYEALNPKIKSLNYLNNILAKIECINAGAAEGVMLNKDGYVAECTGDNIFIVEGNEILTPPTYAGILVGITRNVVIDLAIKAGMKVKEEQLTRYDLYIADECFLTGTAAGIIPVVRIDGRKISSGKPGNITCSLLEKYNKLTKLSSN
ncbi:MAG: branched-chain-amino-acid transaminase [Candidatus Scalindua sediminis]|nr:branched-chain-amino-acid transaminase [Candidatus Scalindua sediminis]